MEEPTPPPLEPNSTDHWKHARTQCLNSVCKQRDDDVLLWTSSRGEWWSLGTIMPPPSSQCTDWTGVLMISETRWDTTCCTPLCRSTTTQTHTQKRTRYWKHVRREHVRKFKSGGGGAAAHTLTLCTCFIVCDCPEVFRTLFTPDQVATDCSPLPSLNSWWPEVPIRFGPWWWRSVPTPDIQHLSAHPLAKTSLHSSRRCRPRSSAQPHSSLTIGLSWPSSDD